MNAFNFLKRTVLPLILCICILYMGRSQTKIEFKSPPAIATILGKGIISDEFGNRDLAISPDGSEFFYTLQYRSGFALSVIMHSKWINGKWTQPEVASFSGQYSDLEPAFSPDGQKLFFSSNRPIDGISKKDFDIWYVTKTNTIWANTIHMEAPINTNKNEFYPSVAKSGTIYMTREMPGADEDIVFCRYIDNTYDTAISLPEVINSVGAEFNAFVDPDEKYIIYTAYKRKGNLGSGDLYISYKDELGNWNESMNMGKSVNGSGLSYCPYVSPDKKSFFFSSSREAFNFPFEKPMKIKEIRTILNSPNNGWDNIYWINAKEWIRE